MNIPTPRRWRAHSPGAAIFDRLLLSVSIASILAACGPSKPQSPAERGKLVYMTKCVVCHNMDPNLSGSQGPPIAGSSRELIEDRVHHLAYPPGYTPKRKTHVMTAFPNLPQSDIDALTAFLAQPNQH